MPTRNDIVNEAKEWVGTPFKHQGRLKGKSCDCIGLIFGVAWVFKLSDMDYRNYGRDPDGRFLEEMCDKHMIISPGMAAGKVALMFFDQDPQHLAIIGTHPAGGFTLIHAASQFKKVVEHRLDPTWERRIIKLYDMPGVTE